MKLYPGRRIVNMEARRVMSGDAESSKHRQRGEALYVLTDDAVYAGDRMM